ncbi:MAG TPA: hypothetical protein VFV47_09880 [Hyphomicrobiaceae bacterium]|nr:hypothetical protein [Hyphomicrobiaceae bacterium]
MEALDDHGPVPRWIYKAVAFSGGLGVLMSGALWLTYQAPDPPTAPLGTAALLVVEDDGNLWSRRFRSEIAPAYSQSPHARRAPMRYVHKTDVHAMGYRLRSRVVSVPTVILVDAGGIEVDRLRGYPVSGARFLSSLDAMFAKMTGP